MPKEFFHYPETKPIFDLIEEAARRSSVSRGQAFEEFLLMSTAALSGGQMEEQYLQVVQKHAAGEKGRRGCDSIAEAFARLVAAMETTRDNMKDILGDLFEGSIGYGEHGLYLTPPPLCQLMARLTVADLPEAEAAKVKTVCDPCCGSGRMLLAVAEIHRHWQFVGQDVDLRML